MIPLVLYFDTESDRDRYLTELGASDPMVHLRWGRATGAAWSCWHTSAVRDNALGGVITHQMRDCVSLRISPQSYASLALRLLIPESLFHAFEKSRKDYAALYQRASRVGFARSTQLELLPVGVVNE